MTCRHRDPINDPDYSSYRPSAAQLQELGRQAVRIQERFGIPAEPDNSKFELLEMLPIGTSMVIRVRYDSCPRCSYEGVKVLVYQDVSVFDVARWRVIDPHFTDVAPASTAHAPSPIARFPANEIGLKLATVLAADLCKG